MAKIVNIEWIQPTRTFQCPCCSAKALKADGKVANQPCQHLLFNWDGNRQDFDHLTDEVESVLDGSQLAVADPLDQALLSSLSDTSVIFEITTREEALGPVVRTDFVAFDTQAA